MGEPGKGFSAKNCMDTRGGQGGAKGGRAFSLCCCNAAQSVCQRRARHKNGASEHAQGSGTNEPGSFQNSVRVCAYVARVISSRPSEEKSDHTLPKFATVLPVSAHVHECGDGVDTKWGMCHPL